MRARKLIVPASGQLLEQLGDRIGDRRPDRGDVVEVDAGLGLRGDGPEEGGAQVERGDAGEHVGGELEEAVVGAGDARVGAAGVDGEVLERDGGVLEGLALDQAGEQQVALAPQGQLVVEVEVVVARGAGAGSSAR